MRQENEDRQDQPERIGCLYSRIIIVQQARDETKVSISLFQGFLEGMAKGVVKSGVSEKEGEDD